MEALAFVTLAGLLALAAAHDVARYEIPNGVCLLVAGAFAPLAYAAGMSPAEVGLAYAIGLATLFGGFVLFHFNVLGGGDAKLIAAVAVWFGLGGLGPFLAAVAVAGGALAAAALAARRIAAPAKGRPAVINRFLERARGVPYAVAIGAGAIAAAPHLSLF